MSDAETSLAEDSVRRFSTWTRIIGVLFIVLGSLWCAGIITAALGIPEIFAGIRMHKAGKALGNRQSGNDSATLAAIVDHIGRFAMIMGIVSFIAIALAVVALAVRFTVLVPLIHHGLGR